MCKSAIMPWARRNLVLASDWTQCKLIGTSVLHWTFPTLDDLPTYGIYFPCLHPWPQPWSSNLPKRWLSLVMGRSPHGVAQQVQLNIVALKVGWGDRFHEISNPPQIHVCSTKCRFFGWLFSDVFPSMVPPLFIGWFRSSFDRLTAFIDLDVHCWLVVLALMLSMTRKTSSYL